MQLSDLLHRLATAFPTVEVGTAEEVGRQRATFADALRKAALHAEGLELVARMLEARQLPLIDENALVVGLSTGKVTVLPVHRSLIAHGYDYRPDDPDVPDRRFGEDKERPF